MNLPDLLKMSGGYWASCALHAGVKLELFTRLSGSPQTAGELAQAVSADERGLTMLLNALTALDLLEKDGDSYQPTQLSNTWLSRDSDTYMGHIIMHHHYLVEGWSRLDEAVRSGGPVRRSSSHEAHDHERESFLLGMFNVASLSAPRIAAQLDLGSARHLLDLAGGPGTYAIHFCLTNPALRATIFDLPTTEPFAKQTVQKFGLADRIDFIGGDLTTDELGNGYDVIWISQLLHSESPDSCRAVVRKAAAALQPGGKLLIQEFILDDSKTSPVHPALFSLNMLIGTPGGQSYSQTEICAMMAEAGLDTITRLELDLPNGAGIIAGVKN